MFTNEYMLEDRNKAENKEGNLAPRCLFWTKHYNNKTVVQIDPTFNSVLVASDVAVANC